MNSLPPQIESYTAEEEKYLDNLLRMGAKYSDTYLEAVLPAIQEIRELKKEKNAVILAHYYMNPLLQVSANEGGVADFVGDSLGLSLEASKVDAENIVFCGVTFMAQTAYIINPVKNVYIPDTDAGCSLASSITGDDVRQLKDLYPGVPVIAYINTYAETKAECDICCTSRNAMKIAASFHSDKLIFIPDKFMGKNLTNSFMNGMSKEFILWDGRCEVHEQFLGNIDVLMDNYPEAEVLLHWEVPDATVDAALKKGHGIVGSTADLINYVRDTDTKQFILGSECDLGATMKGMFTDKQFITPCITCNYMKKIDIFNTLDTLRAIGTNNEEKYKIRMETNLRERAYLPIKRMLEFS